VTLYLAGTFGAKESAIEAIRELKSSGYGSTELDVFSDEPVELPRGLLDRPSRMSLAVVSGAAIFFMMVVSFVYFTQYNYRLVTGGMPLFSFWSTGVVFYEVTMLGAIFTTLGWFIWESGLLRRDKRIPVPAIQPETICLRIRCAPERFDNAASILKKTGARNVAKLERDA
jgi:hypothetical protein